MHVKTWLEIQWIKVKKLVWLLTPGKKTVTFQRVSPSGITPQTKAALIANLSASRDALRSQGRQVEALAIDAQIIQLQQLDTGQDIARTQEEKC